MIKMSEKTIVTKLNLIEGYKFMVNSDVDYIPDFLVDETKPDGEGTGPNPSRLLAAAVGHCISSSLIFCLKKARIPVKNLETTVETNLFRNRTGKTRINSIDIQLNLKVNDQDKPRINRCLTLFEDYCTVTQSIRKGIEVNLTIK
jgi:uncharacterized OsmC-like protein